MRSRASDTKETVCGTAACAALGRASGGGASSATGSGFYGVAGRWARLRAVDDDALTRLLGQRAPSERRHGAGGTGLDRRRRRPAARASLPETTVARLD